MSSVYQILAETVEELLTAIEEHKNNPNTFIFFTGALGEDGESWCEDCKYADPVIEKGLEEVPEGFVFILCVVGDEKAWKSDNNKFKSLPDITVPEIPMILKLGTKECVDHTDCRNEEMVKKFLRG